MAIKTALITAVVLCAVVIYFVFFNSTNVKLTFKGKNGDEKFIISDITGKVLLDASVDQGTSTSSGSEYTIDTNEKSIFVSYINDSSERDLYLRKIKINGKEVDMKKHIRGDLRFPDDEKKRNAVLDGKFLWKTINEGSIYRIDL